MKKIISLILLSLSVIACERNHAPVITGLTCLPDTRTAGTIFTFRVLASDKDGDMMIYHWTADEGLFTTMTNSKEVGWKSPVDEAGRELSVMSLFPTGRRRQPETLKFSSVNRSWGVSKESSTIQISRFRCRVQA